MFNFTYDSTSDQFGYIRKVAGADTFVPFKRYNEVTLIWDGMTLFSNLLATYGIISSKYGYVDCGSQSGVRNSPITNEYITYDPSNNRFVVAKEGYYMRHSVFSWTHYNVGDVIIQGVPAAWCVCYYDVDPTNL